MAHGKLMATVPALALLTLASCSTLPSNEPEVVEAELVRKPGIELTDGRLDMQQPLSTWLFPCLYRVRDAKPGDGNGRMIVVLHEGIERWQISRRYAERTVGARFRLKLGRVDAFAQYKTIPAASLNAADMEPLTAYPWYFDLDEAPHSLQKLRADYRMWKDLRNIKP